MILRVEHPFIPFVFICLWKRSWICRWDSSSRTRFTSRCLRELLYVLLNWDWNKSITKLRVASFFFFVDFGEVFLILSIFPPTPAQFCVHSSVKLFNLDRHQKYPRCIPTFWQNYQRSSSTKITPPPISSSSFAPRIFNSFSIQFCSPFPLFFQFWIDY